MKTQSRVADALGLCYALQRETAKRRCAAVAGFDLPRQWTRRALAVIDTICLKRVHFEVLGGQPTDGRVGCEIRAHARNDSEGRASVLLVARFFENEPNPPFRLELAVEGKFLLEPNETPAGLARGPGPSALFPYLREEVAQLTLRAGLPPLVLPSLSLCAPVQVREEMN